MIQCNILIQYIAVQCSSLQYSIVAYDVVQYSIVQYSNIMVWYSKAKHSSVQYSIVWYSIMQNSIVQYGIVQGVYYCTSTPYSAVKRSCFAWYDKSSGTKRKTNGIPLLQRRPHAPKENTEIKRGRQFDPDWKPSTVLLVDRPAANYCPALILVLRGCLQLAFSDESELIRATSGGLSWLQDVVNGECYVLVSSIK